MSNDRLEPFNYHNIAFKRCADVVSLERLDRLWFFRHHWFVKIGWFGKCWTDLLAFWGVWNRFRILNFGPDRLFFRFSRALHGGHLGYQIRLPLAIQNLKLFRRVSRLPPWPPSWILQLNNLAILNLHVTSMPPIKFRLYPTYCLGGDVVWRISRWRPSWILEQNDFSNSEFP